MSTTKMQPLSKKLQHDSNLGLLDLINMFPLPLEENWALLTNQFVITCNYLSFVAFIAYFQNLFLYLVMFATTLQLTFD